MAVRFSWNDTFFEKNSEYKYILCVIDWLTKFTCAIPLKSKTAKEVTNAMAKILHTGSPH